MPINIHILSESKNILKYSNDLRTVSESTVKLVEDILPIENIDIVIYENPQATIDEIGGIGGFTPNENLIFISLNVLHPDFDIKFKEELKFTLAHELHHTIRWQKQVEGDTLLEAMVFEGLADHFAIEATGRNKPSPWSTALNSEQKNTLFKKASEVWNEPSYDHNLWFFGSKPDVIPRWTGYTLGYDIVGKYLQNNPQANAALLAKVDATLFM